MYHAPTELLPGLWRIRLPFHVELNHVNLHLVRLEEGWMLVDAGFGNDECFAALEQSMREIGVGWTDIRELFITHTHPDHWGLAPRVLQLSGARLSMHRVEAAQLQRMAEAVHKPSVLDKRLRSWGTPEDLIARITGAFLSFRQKFDALKPDRALEDGDTVASAALGPLQVVFTPGHAPGHVCLHSSSRRVFVSGDHVLPKISPAIAWMEEGDALADYKRSLEKVAALDVGLVIPSHGDPFADLAARAAEIWRHHEDRCAAIRAAVADGARTAHDVVGVLWPKVLSPFNYRFGIYEVMAHVKYMGLEL